MPQIRKFFLRRPATFHGPVPLCCDAAHLLLGFHDRHFRVVADSSRLFLGSGLLLQKQLHLLAEAHVLLLVQLLLPLRHAQQVLQVGHLLPELGSLLPQPTQRPLLPAQLAN